MNSASTQAQLPELVREMLELLRAELTQMSDSLLEVLELGASPTTEAPDRRDVIEHFAEQVERFGEATEAVGFERLNRLCRLTHERLCKMADEERPLSEAEVVILGEWSSQVGTYLEGFGNRAVCETFVEYHAHAAWPSPLAEDEGTELVLGLMSPTFELEEAKEPRQSMAAPEDVSLALPDDVDSELLEGLLQELPVQTADFSSAVQKLVQGGEPADVELAQRVAHTLKGAANTVGVRGIANLTHHLEDIFLALSKHERLPTPALANTLMNAADCLEGMSEALMGLGVAPEDALTRLQEVLDWANRIDREGLPDDALEATAEHRKTTVSLPEEAAESAPALAPTQMVRVPAPLLDGLLRVVGETMILTGQIQERVQQIQRHTHSMSDRFTLLQQLGLDLEQLIDLRDMSMPQQRVAGGDFDPLELDQYNELHTCSHRLVEAATDSREMGAALEENLAALDNMLVDQGRLNRESQEAVLQTRMVAVQTILPRLQRSVRQTCRLTAKEVALQVSGNDTLMDSDVLGDLVDPLMHVLRNAVDHGIEPPARRRACGKDEAGIIDLGFHREGNFILVRCKDDGAGVDLDGIRRVAESRGLIEAGQPMAENDLIRLMLQPNFSTREDVTQVSGRGIGLDAVHGRVLDLGGSLSIQTRAGAGCTVELRLPVTLISTHALLVQVQRHVYAISNRGIEQILHSGMGDAQRLGNEMTLRVGDNLYGATDLEALLSLGGDRRCRGRDGRPALLVQAEDGIHAVFVQQVIDSRDVVIKSLGRFAPKLPGVSGAAILGDGSVAPVLDLPELFREPTRRGAMLPEAQPSAAPTEEREAPTAVVVDDSLSARRALARFIEDAGYQVRTARDGLEAINIVNVKRPDLILADLEMPRMNGLELTSHIRARPDTKDLPIIMITSRSTEKHRQQAYRAGVSRYLTKPFSEDQLLDEIAELRGGPSA